MLLKDILSGKRIVLGSASPRRKELLEGIGIRFKVEATPNTPEVYDPSTPLEHVPTVLARNKSEYFHRPLEEDEILITADTVVICNDMLLGKPKDKHDAKCILNMLSDNTHKVITGVCIRTLVETREFSSMSEVTFRPLTDEEIEYYISNYHPFDKAGSYGIQEWIGYIGISSISGSYFNVMGLPIHRLHDELKAMFE